jgi:ribonuclease-3
MTKKIIPAIVSFVSSDTFDSGVTSESNVPNTTLDLSRDHIDRKTIEKIAGMAIGKDITLYQRAFVHKSIEKIAIKDPNAKEYMKRSNETLEFVGDSMLGAVVADYLFRKYPGKDEGFLTTTRTKIVKSETLSFFGEKIGMRNNILMTNQAIKTGGESNKRFLEDAFESFLGAIYYDKGFEGVKIFLMMVIDKHFDESLVTKNDNYKDILLRYSQHVKTALPEYNVIREEGLPHNREFLVEIILFGKRQGKAKGRTIKKAEQDAAKMAISRLDIDWDF